MISKLSRRNLLPKVVNRQLVPAALRISTSMLLIVIISFFASCDNPIFDELEKALHEKKSKCESVPGPAQLLVTVQQGASGSTIGPGGALYVAEAAAGRISRIDPKTGDVTTFASGLPLQLPDVGMAVCVTSPSLAEQLTPWSCSSALMSAAAMWSASIV